MIGKTATGVAVHIVEGKTKKEGQFDCQDGMGAISSEGIMCAAQS